MDGEFFFWAMLGLVALAILSGAILGTAHNFAFTFAGCLAVAALASLAVIKMLDLHGWQEGVAIIPVAAFLFALVISVAFALLVRRIRTRSNLNIRS